ncbi:hypothetical protein RHS01_07812 [Rhizoctonia solani]|uniref:Uncharacterized protein n=1 Tax=Rhizoctonia solani TaxID=456999 RepID=A0A8H7I6K9_9AGAM|nr:hypothetical protein RHS01_07812 [Rhizoctonia solani]
MFLNKQLFLAATCGRNGCPVLDKATERGRAQVTRRRHKKTTPQDPNGQCSGDAVNPGTKRTHRWKSVGMGICRSLNVNGKMGTMVGHCGRDSGEPYRGTSPMGVKEGVSLGVDVSHLAPPARPVDAGIIDRASRGPDDFGGGDKSKESSRDRQTEESRDRGRDNETQQETHRRGSKRTKNSN